MMKTAFLLFTVCVIGLAFFSGCTYDTEQELYGTACDTTHVTYSATVRGLLNAYGCAGCHYNAAPSGGISLEDHAAVAFNINRVWGAINHFPGFHPMPDGSSKMNACDINKMKAWMDAGTPNN